MGVCREKTTLHTQSSAAAAAPSSPSSGQEIKAVIPPSQGEGIVSPSLHRRACLSFSATTTTPGENKSYSAEPNPSASPKSEGKSTQHGQKPCSRAARTEGRPIISPPQASHPKISEIRLREVSPRGPSAPSGSRGASGCALRGCGVCPEEKWGKP